MTNLFTFTDKNTGYKFCTINDQKKDEVDEYKLANWSCQFVTKEGSFVDIGAHIGAFSILLSGNCKYIHAFEPNKDTYECIAMGIANNNRFNILTYRYALGKDDHEAELYQHSTDGYRCTVGGHAPDIVYKQYVVNVKPLDSFNIDNIDLIKIDVGDDAVNVLQGASLTLKNNNYPPILLMITNGASRTSAFNNLKSMGYKLFPITGCSDTFLANEHPDREVHKNNNVKQCESANNADESDDQYNDAHILLELAKRARHDGRHKDAYNLARSALKYDIESTKNELYHEIFISAYYIGEHEEGSKIGEQFLLRPGTEWDVRNKTIGNMKYYIKPLNKTRKIPIAIELPEDYISSSSSIIHHHDNTYKCILRTVNYSIEKTGRYIMRDPQGYVRTRNFLVSLNSRFFVTDVHEMTHVSSTILYPKNIIGFEDVRAIDGTNKFMCTSLELMPHNGTPQICLCEYQDNGDITMVKHLRIPGSTDENPRCEKNWMPFLKDGNIHFIYSTSPFKLYMLCEDTYDPILVKMHNYNKYNLSDLRGSSPPIPYNNGWLATLHHVHHSDHEARKYYHRLVWFNNDFTTIKFSKLFYFERIGIEFNLSICNTNEGVLFTYSVKDNTSSMLMVQHEEVQRMISCYEDTSV